MSFVEAIHIIQSNSHSPLSNMNDSYYFFTQIFLCKILLDIVILNLGFIVGNHIHFCLHNVNSRHLVMLC